MKLNNFMNQGIKNIIETAARFYLNNRRGQSFMLKMGSAFHRGSQIRDEHEKKGLHIPPFLIASIASDCNLHCTGCYAWANGGCGGNTHDEMTTTDWRRIFGEASDIGISFILLAGGEPLMRRDVIETAAELEKIIFPVFTNGTMIDEQVLSIFDTHRNLIPVLSIEGDEEQTDARRGSGISEKIKKTTLRFREKNILYGVSITVSTENKDAVTEQGYVNSLRENGCGVVFYIEYVPVEKNTEQLILNDTDLSELQERIDRLRADKLNKGMILLSFPGDEDAMGGCLAAGRGFFHINPYGGAEPCPFSPYSEMNLKQHSLIEVLESPFFEKVREISASEALNHKGGCTLFQHEDEVKCIESTGSRDFINPVSIE
ncbi:MAG: radical SAM protein [Lachnoclostridium sp.]|jgi:MoaA/NifB/PqqE/SkfB family radical SAM enzyme|nr:radical SAM protein [Lachnoclostridium sp.]